MRRDRHTHPIAWAHPHEIRDRCSGWMSQNQLLVLELHPECPVRKLIDYDTFRRLLRHF
jgi:hypothetical protein